MKSKYAFYVTLVCLLACTPVFAAEFADHPLASKQPRFLPVEEAFQLSVTRRGDEQVRLRWFIMPGYYLYRHALRFGDKAAGDPGVEVPEGIHKVDEYFGEVQVYYEELIVDVPVGAAGEQFDVLYQGCAEAGFCYPPQKMTVNVANL